MVLGLLVLQETEMRAVQQHPTTPMEVEKGFLTLPTVAVVVLAVLAVTVLPTLQELLAEMAEQEFLLLWVALPVQAAQVVVGQPLFLNLSALQQMVL
jgi:hypothetical protein